MTDVSQCVARCLAESDTIPPRPPAAHLMNELLQSAGHVIAASPALRGWMDAVGLDPTDKQDALIAIGVAISASRVPLAEGA